MEYFNNKLCVSGTEIIISDSNPNGIISASLFKKWKRSGVNTMRRASYCSPSLIEFNSIPSKYKDEIALKLGVPAEQAVVKPFKDKIIADANAVTYYSNYRLADGRLLPEKTQRDYAINAAVLNAVKQVYYGTKESRSKVGTSLKGFWKDATLAINSVRAEVGHTLPSKEVPFKRTFTKYLTNSYSALISGKFCNDNSRKVSDALENLMMSLYAMPNKPFAAQVHTLYHLFIAGKFEVVDRNTGEVIDREQFIQNGQPITVSEATVWNYLNQPQNRAIVDRQRMGAHRYNGVHRPHHHRSSPEFSFSKISMDDRDLPRKCVNGKWVKSYYAYDVTSGCVVGYAHSLFKNEELFLDCMRNMLQFIELEGMGMPMEVEVENHLVNKFFDDLALMFPFLRVCAPGNSQEKRAEHFNRAKKYGEEKKSQNNIGRWWSKHEAYTVDRDKKGDEFVDKVMLPYERLVADDIKSIHNYNNQLHPKQKKYPGKTRFDVLRENLNPNSPVVNKPLVYKAIGYKTETSIRRNQYVYVRSIKYALPTIDIINKLLPNNHTVEACWLPDREGMVPEVYLYQKDVFLCKADKLIIYNESKAEETAADVEARKKQGEFVGQFDAMTKRGKKELSNAVIIENSTLKEALEAAVELAPVVEIERKPSVEDLIQESDNDFMDAADEL